MTIETPSIVKRTGEEAFTCQGQMLDVTLKDFWSWAYSDILNNATRGVLAEFIVMHLLGIERAYRLEWDAFDIETQHGLKLEIKSSAYVQSWKQHTHSRITFGIQPTQGWNATTNAYAMSSTRQSDVYIFCVLTEKDPHRIDPLQLEQWDFYLVETSVLNEVLGAQKTLGLQRLFALHPIHTDYRHLKEEIDKLERKYNLL
jgi:hypothetical protein